MANESLKHYLLSEKAFLPEDYHVEDREKLELLKQLGAIITDRRDKATPEDITENDPKVWALDMIMNKEEVRFMLSFEKKRVNSYSVEQLAEKNHMTVAEARSYCDNLCRTGILEFDRETEDKSKRYFIPKFVVGSGEYMMMNNKLIEEHPEIATLFSIMAQAAGPIADNIPPGGGGLGMHVIPVEKAIPAESQSVSVEHISHWLKKYDKYALEVCSCRRQQRILGEGTGDIEGAFCIALGDMAEYVVESGKEARYATYEECMEVLQRAEQKGFLHQIVNIDGENKCVGICNCAPGACNGIRSSQLFNTPNMSASAYRAHVDKSKCVACGKCVEVCPVGAAKLGQKLCKKDGSEVAYPKTLLPDETPWGVEHWNYQYRDDAKINCYSTGTAPCKTACPVHLSVQGYVQLAGEGRYMDALKLIKQDNPFPAVCGDICNRRCEARCTRGTIDQPVAIDEIKKFIAARELNAEDRYIPVCENDEGKQWGDDYKIAVIGGGPAGLTAAYYLRTKGYSVTVFEKEKKPGGMLRHGIPSFRLEKNVIDAEIDVIQTMGADIRCGVEVGKDVTIQQLREEGYKGFYVAVGLQNGGRLNIPGDSAEGVISGIDFSKQVNLTGNVQLTGHVVVIGGGNIAADVARTAVRCGAESVSLYCLEGYDDMPMGEEDRSECEQEGISVHAGWGPVEISAVNGKADSIRFRRCLSVKNAEGRFSPVFDDAETETAQANTILYCIGQHTEWGQLLAGTKVEFNPNGTAKADPVTLQTAEPDIFVGGDAYTGQKFVIDAIASGREAAISLNRFVHPGQSLTIGRDLRQFIELDREDVQYGDYDTTKRQRPAKKPGDETKTFADLRLPLTEEQVQAEAKRCLHCGATTVDENRCIGCGLCTTRCEFDAIHLTRDIPEASQMYTSEEGFAKAIMPYAMKRKEIIVSKMKQG